MKKIFAFVLASIMVLSLVPASAFAAITKDCELPHTLDNCEWTLVETVKPTCNKDDTKGFGYTVYECNACGEQFLANFVEPLAHTWKDNSNSSDRKNQTLNCKEEDDGIKYVKCTVCGKTEKQVTPWNQGHTPKYVSGFGCEALYECTVCGLEFYGLDKNNEPKPEAGHDWEFTKVEVEPVIKNGVVTPGYALFTCKDCKDTKSVEITSPACKCDGFQDIYCTKIVSYKAPNCTDKGTNAVLKCDDCNQLWEADKDGKILGKIEKVEDAVLEATGHTVDGKKTTTGCKVTYKCKTCKKTITEYNHDKDDPYVVVTEYSTVDCVNYGYSVWLCNYCGWNEAKFEEPTGHKTETVVVDSTCATFGYVYQYCTNENCSVTVNKTPGASVPNLPTYYYTLNGIQYEVGVEDENGVLQPVKVVSLVRNTALNPNAHDIVLIASQEVTCDQPGLEVYKCKFCNVMSYKTIPALSHDFDEEKTEYLAPSCTAPGYIQKYCKNCQQMVTVATLPFTPGVHNYEVFEKHHNCVEPTASAYINPKNGRKYHGYDIYKCTGCNETLIVYNDPVPTAPKTWFADKDEAELYHFGAAYLQEDGTWAYTYTGDLQFQSVGAAATCYTNGYDIYKCEHCDKLVYVTTPKLDHTNFKKTDAIAATCSKTGNIEYYTCYVCNEMFVLDKDGKQVAVTAAEVVTNKHTGKNLKQQFVYDCSGNVIATYWKCTTKNDGKTCGTLWTDETATTKYTGTTKDVAHKYTTIVEYVAATCELDNVVGVYYCATCDTYMIKYNTTSYSIDVSVENGSVDVTPSGYSIEVVEKENLTLDQVESYDFPNTDETIEIYIGTNGVRTANAISACAKFEHGYVNSKNIQNAKPGEWWLAITTTVVEREDCSEVSYNHNHCEICNFEYLDNYKPASSKDGHVNKYGDKIPTDCGALQALSEAKRTCFYCGEVVAPKHTLLNNPVHVDGTCSTDGYDYDYCVKCGYRQVVKVYWADADAYHADKNNWVDVGVTADYANKGDSYHACNSCGKQMDDVKKVDAKKTGIEIVLTTDADSYVLGSTIYVTVALDSFYGANVWGLDFTVKYDPATVEFLDEETEWVTKTFTETHDAAQQLEREEYTDEDGKTTIVKVPTGEIKVAANAKENVLVKGSQDLVVLAFKVIDPNAFYAEFLVPVYKAEYNRLSGWFAGFTSAVTVVDEKGKAVNCLYNEFDVYAQPDYDAEDFDYEAWENEFIYDGETTGELAQAIINPLLDVDGDFRGGNDLTMADILALYELIVFGEYSVTADTDFNGIVNMIDLANAYHVLVGRTTVEELAGVIPSDWIPADGAKN